MRSLLSVVLALAICPAARAEVRLPALVGSHMVLQRDAPSRVWGWATPAETVRVSIGAVARRGDGGGRRPVERRPPAAARRRAVHPHDRRAQHDRARGRVVRRGVGRLRPVQHGVAARAVDGRPRGRGGRLRRPAAVHRGEGHVAPAEGRRDRPVVALRRDDRARLLGGGLLLRPGPPPRPGGQDRPRPLLLGRDARRGVDEPRGPRRRALAAADGGGLRRCPATTPKHRRRSRRGSRRGRPPTTTRTSRTRASRRGGRGRETDPAGWKRMDLPSRGRRPASRSTARCGSGAPSRSPPSGPGRTCASPSARSTTSTPPTSPARRSAAPARRLPATTPCPGATPCRAAS